MTADQALVIPAGSARLQGDLAAPANPLGLVLFAHGSGSGRKSTRNQLVARSLNTRGMATLLFDLLTVEEEQTEPNLRFDIPLLSSRLAEVTDWIVARDGWGRLPMGYFGASTGAAAALIAAGERPEILAAVVCRGGRPDLAWAALPEVRAPTLLVVGGKDSVVLDLNRRALLRLRCEARLAIVPGAMHLFEEPGALEQVAALAGDWLSQHLGSPATAAVAEPGAGLNPLAPRR